jgi:nicotinamide-nucleotide amidase
MTAGPAAAHRSQMETATTERAGLDLSKISGIRPLEYAERFAFAFAVSVVAGAVSRTAGPRVGGLFLAFPAILPATLTLLEKKEGLPMAVSDIRGATLGAVGMLGFALLAAGLMRDSASLALGGGLLLWAVVAAVLYLALRSLARLLGEKKYLPEIPTSDAAAAVGLLLDRHLTVATAESCTGGLVAALLSSVPRASEAFRGSVVAYNDDLKAAVLGVPRAMIDEDSAVSGRVATAMAEGARRVAGSDVGVGVTGVSATPIGGRPPGLTYVAVSMNGVTRVAELSGDEGPTRNEERAARRAIEMISEVVERT